MRIAKQEFARRRKALMEHMAPNTIAIIPTAPEVTRNRDAHYPYRPESDFYYLSGFDEPEAVLVLVPGREHGEVVLFCREKDKDKEIWDGYRSGPEGAIAKFGADDAFPVEDMDEILPGLLEGRQTVFYSMGRDADFDRQVMEWVNAIRSNIRSGAMPPGEFVDLDHMLHDLRLVKSSGEIKLMRRAGEISAQAHVRAMKFCHPGVYEYQLEAEILHHFGMEGARWPAYSTIVGAGANGCILHYIENNKKVAKDDLVLIDAGCELDYYAADITRTFPASGKFSEAQAQLYQVVLDAQYAAMAQTVAGNHWDQPHEAAVLVIAQGLLDLGLLTGELDEVIQSGRYRRFYMHRTGHWLGMDVHDVGDYKVDGQWRQLEAGMVLTIEPGIYVAPDDDTVDEKWRGIGIRIEDDVVVTKEGPCEVLTADVPKEIADIEALMSGQHTLKL